MKRAVLSVLVIFIVFLVGLGVYMYNAAIIDGRRGVLIRFSTPTRGYANWRQVEVQVTAIHAGTGHMITLFMGFLGGTELFLNSREQPFKGLLESYTSMHVKNLSTCLMLDIWVYQGNRIVWEAKPPVGVAIEVYKALNELVVKDVTVNVPTISDKW